MKTKKSKIIKIISYVLIETFLLLNFASSGAGEISKGMFCRKLDTLAPQINLDNGRFQNVYLSLTALKKVTGKENAEYAEKKEKDSKKSLAVWLHNKFAERFNRISRILSFIIKEKDSKGILFMASVMTAVNWIVDIYITNLILKVSIFTACVLSGNFFLIFVVGPVSLFTIGGFMRLGVYSLFNIIWPHRLRLTKNGLLVNFIPWGLGNFAPLLFTKADSKPQDLWLANEIRNLARLVEKSVERHTYASREEKKIISRYSIEIAEAIWEYQRYLDTYDYRRFKVRGTRGYSDERILSLITREDKSEGIPLSLKIQRWILEKFKIQFPGYSKGTRPILLFGKQERLKQIRGYLKQANLSDEYLKRVYQFDITEFLKAIKEVKEDSAEIKSAAADSIKPMFILSKGRYAVKGSDGCFHVQNLKTKKLFEDIENGSEIHIITPGGGGDTLGAVFLILQLKEIFKQQGKNGIFFKIIFPNVKYGRENPFSTPLDPEHFEGLENLPIGDADNSHFYKIKQNLRAKIPVLDNNHDQIMINKKPLFYEADWSEGKIVDLLAKENIELIMIDLTKNPQEIREHYLRLKEGKKVVSLFCDLGGDCLAQIPERLENNKQLESTIASPVSDLTGLVIFDAPAIVMALGGDGELVKAIPNYLKQYFKNNQVSAVLDNLQYLKQNPEILDKLGKYIQMIKSEVSKNLLLRLREAVEEGRESPIVEFGPWNYEELLKKDNHLKAGYLRYERRKEFLPKYYFSTLLIKDTGVIREKVKDKNVLRRNMTWEKRSDYLRSLNYITEDVPFITYRAQVKQLSHRFLNLLRHKEFSLDEMWSLFLRDDIPEVIQLATARAMFMFYHPVDEYNGFTNKIGERLISLMQNKKLDIFLIAEVAKTIGIIGDTKGIPILREFLKEPKRFGTWNFYPNYYYTYAKARLKSATERSLYNLTEKVLSQNGLKEAWRIYLEIMNNNTKNKYLLDLFDRLIKTGTKVFTKKEIPAYLSNFFIPEKEEQKPNLEIYVQIMPTTAWFLNHVKNRYTTAMHASYGDIVGNEKLFLNEIEIANKINTQVYVLHLNQKAVNIEDYAESFIPLAQKAKEYAIKLAVENCPCEGKWSHTVEDLREFFALIKEKLDKDVYENVYICLDVGHANVAYEPTEGKNSVQIFIERLKDYGMLGKIGHIHIHDNQGRLPSGVPWDTHSKEGTIDILSVLKQLQGALNKKQEGIFVTWEGARNPFNLSTPLADINIISLDQKKLSKERVFLLEIETIMQAI